MSDDITPRHLRVALATATQAFQSGDFAVFGTFNEDLQPVVDAAMAQIRSRDATIGALRADAENMLWNLGGVSSVCMGALDADFTFDETSARAALGRHPRQPHARPTGDRDLAALPDPPRARCRRDEGRYAVNLRPLPTSSGDWLARVDEATLTRIFELRMISSAKDIQPYVLLLIQLLDLDDIDAVVQALPDWWRVLATACGMELLRRQRLITIEPALAPSIFRCPASMVRLTLGGLAVMGGIDG